MLRAERQRCRKGAFFLLRHAGCRVAVWDTVRTEKGKGAAHNDAG